MGPVNIGAVKVITNGIEVAGHAQPATLTNTLKFLDDGGAIASASARIGNGADVSVRSTRLAPDDAARVSSLADFVATTASPSMALHSGERTIVMSPPDTTSALKYLPSPKDVTVHTRAGDPAGTPGVGLHQLDQAIESALHVSADDIATAVARHETDTALRQLQFGDFGGFY